MDSRKANRMDKILKVDFTEFRNDFPTFAGSFDEDGRPGKNKMQFISIGSIQQKGSPMEFFNNRNLYSYTN